MKTDEQILAIASEILSSGGLGALSFDAIARKLGRTKQAVLYWYPTKSDLLAALFLPLLESEADTAVKAVAHTGNRTEAVAAFVQAIAGFHLDNLDRFRLMYLAPQTTQQRGRAPDNQVILQNVPPITSRIYDALTPHFGSDPVKARQQAVAIHAAVLGLVLMVALSDALDDPLKHPSSNLVDALITSLVGT